MIILALFLLALGIKGMCGIVVVGNVPCPINIPGVFTLVQQGQGGWQVLCPPPYTESCILILPMNPGQQPSIRIPGTDIENPIEWPYVTQTREDGSVVYIFTPKK